MKRLLPLIIMMTMFGGTMAAQNIAVKTNLLGDATASVNLGLEIGLAPKWTLDMSGSVNFWDMGEMRKWRHWMVQPEARYWFCDRFNGHFLGVHAIGGQYNIGGTKLIFSAFPNTKDYRYQGWGVGAGVAYGYQWILSKKWSLEATLGAGYIYSEYEQFPCAECGTMLSKGTKNYFGITKAGITLIYIIK